MAECSYARCLLERRLIKRELMKWSKDMLHIVGLERVAEELMGRRKWKYFQEEHTKGHMSTESTATTITTNKIAKDNNLKETIEEDRPKTANSQDEYLNSNLLKKEETQLKEERICSEENDKEHHKESSQNNINKETTENKIGKENKAELTDKAVENNNNKGDPETQNITTNTNSREQSNIVEHSPQTNPVDWKPEKKCNFCINGKLLTVNAKGELVAESGPAMSETDVQRLDTDSDSGESSNVTGGVSATENDYCRLDLTKLLTSHQEDFSAKMASINSLAPQLATIQSLSGQYFQNLNWLQLAQQSTQHYNSATQSTSEISATALSPSLKDSPSPSDATGEQPLDLSSKPSPNSSTCGDLKAIRTKSSRSTPISTGRQAYSDEDLNNALQDVLSGKSGTRKAAVRYSVPRSTLHNKMQALQNPMQQMEVHNSDEDVEAEADSSASVHQPIEGQQTIDESFPMTLLKKLTEKNGNSNAFDANAATKNTNKTQNSTAPLLAEALAQGTQPAALLQAIMLLASNFGGLDDRVSVRDLLSALLVNSGSTGLKIPTDANDTNVESANLNNGRNTHLILQRLLLHQLQQENQHLRASPFTSRLATSDTPETNSSLDPNDDEQSSILKIPSYRPVAGASGTRERSISPSLVNNNNNNSLNSNLHRNGDSPQSAASPHIPTSLLATVGGGNLNANCSRQSNIPVISPPLPSHQSLGSTDSQSPPSICFRDMIANSIHRTMSDQANKEAQATTAPNDYKKPSISVVKNIGGTDTSRFGAAPNVLSVVGSGSALHHNHQSQYHMQSHHSHHSHHLSRQEAAALAAGKGTRPKRGKYRNYDRDSLVEAVKAVQRGEMSVHRAGSYYGVPHSTLEYKVKERHLMRPRKREPKPQPGLDSTSNAASTSKSNSNIHGLQNSLDKLKAGGGGSNPNLKQLNSALKSNNNSAMPYPSASPNGIKLPLFDPAAMAQLQYAPQFFWQHGPTAAFSQFSQQIDLNRNVTATQSSVAHMQRLRDETMPGKGNSPSPDTSPMSSQNHHQFTPETLYESGGTNGSFLDGIIRKTLDRKASIEIVPHSSTNASNSVSSGALLDQLVKKTPLPFTNNRSNEFSTNIKPAFSAAGGKRSTSPAAFPGIKRERTTPPMPSVSSDDEDLPQRSVYNAFATEAQHNSNKKNNIDNANGNGRVHNASDSETDTPAVTIQVDHTSHNSNLNHKAKSEDVNGGADAAMLTIKPTTSPAPLSEPDVIAPTSILHEKLAQIKAEQESEVNL